MKTVLATAAALLAASLPLAEAQNRALLLPGQTLPGAGTIANVGEFAMNSHGSWVALVQTDLPTPSGFGVLVRDGQPVFVPDGVTLAPAISGTALFLDLDDEGNIGYRALDPVTGDWHLMRNATTLLKRGDLVDVDGDGVAEPVTGFRAVHLAKDGSGAIYAVLLAETKYHLVRLLRTSTGALESQVILTPGQTLPTGAVVASSDTTFLRFRSQLDTNADGDLAFALGLKGVFRYHLNSGTLETVVKQGDPSPFATLDWNIDIFQSIALSDAGAVYFPSELAGNGQSLDVLAQDQQALLFEGQALQFPSGQSVGDILTSSSVRVSQKGQVLWAGAFQGPDGTARPGFARDNKVVVLGGSTRVEGHTIEAVALTVDGGQNFTGDGERILFRGRTTGNLVGLFEVNTAASVETVAGCTPKLAGLTPFAGATAFTLGQAFGPAVQLSNPQGANAVGLLLVSPLGSGGCGTLLPGVGEVLVNLQPGLLMVQTPVFGGALFTLPALPQSLAFQGQTIYAQGLWFDSMHAFEPVRLSNALRYVAGL